LSDNYYSEVQGYWFFCTGNVDSRKS